MDINKGNGRRIKETKATIQYIITFCPHLRKVRVQLTEEFGAPLCKPVGYLAGIGGSECPFTLCDGVVNKSAQFFGLCAVC